MTGTLHGLMIFKLQEGLLEKGIEVSYDTMSHALLHALDHVNREIDVNESVELPTGSTFVKTYDSK